MKVALYLVFKVKQQRSTAAQAQFHALLIFFQFLPKLFMKLFLF